MADISKVIASELNLKNWQVENALSLKAEGATVPFIARYRKERTGELDEVALRNAFERHEYLTALNERKEAVIKSISAQGKLTSGLEEKIKQALSKTELEDLYLPFKPKRRTKGAIAKERGLGPLAESINQANISCSQINLKLEAGKYINPEKGVESVDDAIGGASDIIAEEISEIFEIRKWIREFIFRKGSFTSKIKKEYEEVETKYDSYREFSAPVSKIPPHNMLALRRGEKEGYLTLGIDYSEDEVLGYIFRKVIKTSQPEAASFFENAAKDSYKRLLKNSIIGETRLERKQYSDEESIKVFESNLRQLLLSPPAGMKPALGIDPGFRTGCKLAAVNETGRFMAHSVIFPFAGAAKKAEAEDIVKGFIEKYEIGLIAIGNGTASRETNEFISELIKGMKERPIAVIVNEAGASVYSASETAAKEFPDLSLTVRGAISIARRLQDPMAELVKIEPKSIGVGQYQHDVNQKLLQDKLNEAVSLAVNYVGADLNTASEKLLEYISGLTPKISENIVAYRSEIGKFTNREELKKVKLLGPKAFEQCAGFLRIRQGDEPLDNTAVHPESYGIAKKILKGLGISPGELHHASEKIKSADLSKYATDETGPATLKDIAAELIKPGRDPREEFKYAKFKEGVKEISDLRKGMELEGVITNVAKFGAFVDIGVHQDGLIHISELADKFVKDPADIVKAGQVVNVLVLDVNENLKRVSLSLKQAGRAKKTEG